MSDFLTESAKGVLIAKFMIRWWYALTWPEVDETRVPAGYEPMDGFQGVFICTGDPGKLGDLLDLRDATTSPSFYNLSRKPSEELKELLVSACTNQVSLGLVVFFKSQGGFVAHAKQLQQLEEVKEELGEDYSKEARRIRFIYSSLL